MTSYDLKIRPVKVFNEVLPVSFDFVLEEVNLLDVKEQTLDISAFVTLTWNDPNLTWEKSSFGGVDETLIDTELVWRPDLSLHNRATLESNPFDYVKNTKVLIKNNGNVTWVIYTSWKSSCSTDVTWWPADRQTCTMKFGSLTYNKRRLSLKRSNSLARINHGAQK